MARVLPIPGPVTRELARAILDQVIAMPLEDGVQFAIWTKDPLRLIGGIGLGERDPEKSDAGLSAMIGEQDQWNKGYATEAARAVVDYGFNELGLRRLWLNHHGFNASARRIADQLGFVEVDRQDDHPALAGQPTDWVTMELLAPTV